ncbi:MAG: histidine kinase [Candidatus Kapabacteria bacterium]|jgi:sensor histidine kinase YesM|nr:histidine kinase [Candidatus Kapabacteria bacterium]
MNTIYFPWLRFFWVPLVAFVFNTINWAIAVTDDFAQQFVSQLGIKIPLDIVLSTAYTVICFEASLWIFIRLERGFPLEKRLKTLMVLHILFSSLLWISLFAISQALLHGFDTPMKRFVFKQNLVLALVIAICMNVVLIGMMLFHRWKKIHSEAEDLKRAHVEAQNIALRQQIDPHFLFNSLNTLTAMIEGEPQGAVRFVQQLSNVYRYVLQSKDHITVSLHEELAFVRAYSELLELRFGANIRIELNIPEEAETYVLPPLSLQLCLENAVKHNIISRQKPLRIRVWVERNTVVVENTLQLRTNAHSSTKIGLATLQHRYAQLTAEPVLITSNSSTFMVSLPLLRSTQTKELSAFEAVSPNENFAEAL